MSPNALYVYAFFTFSDPPLPEETPEAMTSDRSLRAVYPPDISTGESSIVALCEETPLSDWTGEEAQQRLTDLEWVVPRAIQHEAVIQWAHEHLAPIYPTSLGTIFSDESSLFATMKDKQVALERYFRRVDRCDQWTVKGFADPDALKASLQDTADPPTSGADYLRRKAAPSANSKIETFLSELSRGLFEELNGAARDHEIVTRQGASHASRDRPLLHWHFLVPDVQQGEFLRRLKHQREICAEQGMQICLSGPLANYNFRH